MKFWKGTILTKEKYYATIGSVDESGASPKKTKRKKEASKNA